MESMSSAPERQHPELTSEEELQKTSVGAVLWHDAPITPAEYDPGWPLLFGHEADRVRAALGDKALRIEHVGSTSVPGLAAKPIIDMVLAAADSADEPEYVPSTEAAGYVLRIREPGWFEHGLFRGPETNINLHVFTEGAAEIDRMVRFRDWRRAHDEDRDRYESVKRDPARRRWRHVQHYADSKTTVISEIMARMDAAVGAGYSSRGRTEQPISEYGGWPCARTYAELEHVSLPAAGM